MSITFVSAGIGAASTGGATPGMPAGATTGDFLLLVIEGEGEDSNEDPIPSGWTLIGSRGSQFGGFADHTRITVAWAWYSAGISRSVPDAGDHTIARIYAFRGVDDITPLDNTPTTGSSGLNSTSQSANSGFASLTDEAMIILAYVHGDDVTAPGTFVNADLDGLSDGGSYSNTAGSDGTVGIIYGVKATAGSAGTFSWTTSASEETAWFVIGLRPKPTNFSPTLVLDTADEASFATGTPTLLFTGTDGESDDVCYELQISDEAFT